MKIWIVSDSDYDNTWVVAVYPTEAMADEHVALMGGDAEEIEVSETLHPDAADPVKQAERTAAAEKERRDYEDHRASQEAQAELRRNTRPRPPHMRLCHCETFSTGRHFVNDHGYCGYCGGFIPEVFRQHMGEDALLKEIDKLAIHDREKMRQIVTTRSSPR